MSYNGKKSVHFTPESSPTKSSPASSPTSDRPTTPQGLGLDLGGLGLYFGSPNESADPRAPHIPFIPLPAVEMGQCGADDEGSFQPIPFESQSRRSSASSDSADYSPINAPAAYGGANDHPTTFPPHADTVIHHLLLNFPYAWDVRTVAPRVLLQEASFDFGDLALGEPGRKFKLRFYSPRNVQGNFEFEADVATPGGRDVTVWDVLDAVGRELCKSRAASFILRTDPIYKSAVQARASRGAVATDDTWQRGDLWPAGPLYFQGLYPEHTDDGKIICAVVLGHTPLTGAL